ncbi:MAG: shikimate kinase [Chitinophagales bacterium]|nr:shikimate kinase [Chitinophagales bacterium]
MSSRIFLVGLMGSGKTHWGKKIAANLGWQFIDLDGLIEENEQRSVADIFEKQGEAHFRALEKKQLEELTAFNNVVVAAGGGAPCFHNNMQLMNSLGETYYLKAKIETLVPRLLHQMNERPLLKGKTMNELPAFFTEQLKQREPFYLQASHIIEAEKLSEENLKEFFQKNN